MRRALLGACFVFSPVLLGAQEADTARSPLTASQLPASPPLPGDHWAVRAAARAEALGLVEHYLPAQRGVPRAVVGAALVEAAARAPAELPWAAGMVGGWLARFAEEFPESSFERGQGAVLLGSRAGVGFEGRAGVAAPGAGLFWRRVGITELPDRSTPEAGAVLAGAFSPHLAAVAGARATRGGVDVPRWDVVMGAGPVALSVGEEPVGYGPAAGGGVVFSGAATLPRVEVQTTRPVRLPWVLRRLGDVSVHTFASRMEEERHPGNPYLWGARGAIRPHPRFTAGVTRGSIFGGDSVSTPVSAGSLARMVVGVLSADFENQVVSMDFRYRAPTERVLPLTLYLEWGADDGAGAWWDVPGRVVGAHVPALPRLPQLALGVEYASFARLCCGNPSWYTHAAHPGGWAARDVTLGHPLGGEGSEHLLYASADLMDARLRVDARAFRRERGDYGYYEANERAGNLFAPERAGTSLGLGADLAWRATPRSELRLAGFREAGDGWAAQEWKAFVSVLF